MIIRWAVFSLTLFCVAASPAALKPGATTEFLVELPDSLRELAGGGHPSAVQHAAVSVALPQNFDPAQPWPILVISATSDPKYSSSRRLMSYYAETAITAGWVVLASDPQEKINPDDDTLPMRFALVTAALAGLERQWPGAAQAPVAFGGFSGGAKHSGWLAAEFATQGRFAIGVYQAGINQETLALAAKQFKVLNDSFRRIPVFLLGGYEDQIAPPDAHHDVESDLKRAGFRNVRLEFFDGPHAVDPRPLKKALEWFAAEAAKPAPVK